MKRGSSATDNDSIDDKPLSIYNIHPNTVERLLLGNKEIVRFNLSSNEQVKKAATCNVSISIIDGMGQEYRSAFKLKDNFSQVIDKSTNTN